MATTTRIIPRAKPARSSNGSVGFSSSPKKPSTAPAVKRNNLPPIAACLYGPSGVGKTSLFANFPRPGFIIDPHEDGINDLVQFKQCPAPVFVKQQDEWEPLLEYIYTVAKGKTGVETLILDSATGFEKLCFQHHCRLYFENNWTKDGFYAYQQGPKNAAKTDWPELIDALKAVWESGISVIMLAHSQVKNVSNPEGEDFDKYIPYLDKETWQALHRWCKALFFYKLHADVKKKGPKSKAIEGSERRLIYTTPTAFWDAKNRYGLPEYIEAGTSPKEAADALMAAIRKAAT